MVVEGEGWEEQRGKEGGEGEGCSTRAELALLGVRRDADQVD